MGQITDREILDQLVAVMEALNKLAPQHNERFDKIERRLAALEAVGRQGPDDPLDVTNDIHTELVVQRALLLSLCGVMISRGALTRADAAKFKARFTTLDLEGTPNAARLLAAFDRLFPAEEEGDVAGQEAGQDGVEG